MKPTNSQYNILIVDDADNNRLLLEDLLTELKYNVLLAKDGNEAYEIVQSKNPDLILLDVMMPGCDGFEFMDRVTKTHESIPIIFITAKSSDEDREKAMKMGAYDYIVKPVNILNIIDKVSKVLPN